MPFHGILTKTAEWYGFGRGAGTRNDMVNLVRHPLQNTHELPVLPTCFTPVAYQGVVRVRPVFGQAAFQFCHSGRQVQSGPGSPHTRTQCMRYGTGCGRGFVPHLANTQDVQAKSGNFHFMDRRHNRYGLHLPTRVPGQQDQPRSFNGAVFQSAGADP